MPIPATIDDLDPVAANNSPAGADSPTEGDNFIRALSAIIRQEHDDGPASDLEDRLASNASAEVGVGLLGLDLSHSYAVGTAGQWLAHEVNVFKWIDPSEWGAILDGTSTFDASTDIISALTFAFGLGAPCRVVFPTGRYKCGAVLGTFTGSNVTIDGQGATLDFSSISVASTDSLLIITGSYGTGVALTSNAAANQKTLAVNSSTFAVGDFVKVYSEAVLDSTRTSARLGELGFIETIPGGSSMTVTMELQSTYNTAATAKVQKLTPVRNVTVKNFRILGPGGNDEIRGLRFLVATNCHFENISSFDVDYFHLQITDSINCTVTKCYIEESNSSSTGYGVSFADASCDCLAYGNQFVNVRHSLSTNNTVATNYGITSRIRFELNDIRDSAQATGGTGGDAIDCHAGAREIYIINNTVHSSSGAGINFEAQGGVISGNVIKHTASVGIYFHPYSDTAGSVLITGNRVDQVGDASGTDPGIYVLGGAVSPARVVITGNHVNSATSEAIRVAGLVGDNVGYLTMTGNLARSALGTSAIRLDHIGRGTVTGNTAICDDGPYGMYIEDSGKLAVNGNSVLVTGTGTTMYGIRVLGTGARLSIVGNVVESSGGGYTDTYGVHLADTITLTGVYCNQFPGIVTADVTLGAGSGNAQDHNV